MQRRTSLAFQVIHDARPKAIWRNNGFSPSWFWTWLSVNSTVTKSLGLPCLYSHIVLGALTAPLKGLERISDLSLSSNDKGDLIEIHSENPTILFRLINLPICAFDFKREMIKTQGVPWMTNHALHDVKRQF
jgi:hypothetical protein